MTCLVGRDSERIPRADAVSFSPSRGTWITLRPRWRPASKKQNPTSSSHWENTFLLGKARLHFTRMNHSGESHGSEHSVLTRVAAGIMLNSFFPPGLVNTRCKWGVQVTSFAYQGEGPGGAERGATVPPPAAWAGGPCSTKLRVSERNQKGYSSGDSWQTRSKNPRAQVTALLAGGFRGAAGTSLLRVPPPAPVAMGSRWPCHLSLELGILGISGQHSHYLYDFVQHI